MTEARAGARLSAEAHPTQPRAVCGASRFCSRGFSRHDTAAGGNDTAARGYDAVSGGNDTVAGWIDTVAGGNDAIVGWNDTAAGRSTFTRRPPCGAALLRGCGSSAGR